MCRVAAFPPGIKREEALEILGKMQGWNKDGVGWAYVRPGGKFVVGQYPGSMTSLMANPQKSKLFLNHMPSAGWTIAHLRTATHGGVSRENTHPFVAGEWAVVHNGCWSGHDGARTFLGKAVKLDGQTDSEVATHLLNVLGPKQFTKDVMGGVFLALNRNGQLWVLQTSGSVEYLSIGKQDLIASDLNYKGAASYEDGWYHYSKNGCLLGRKAKAPAADKYWSHPWTNATGGSHIYRYPGGEHMTAGNDEPLQAEVVDEPTDEELRDGATGWYLDKDQHWRRSAPTTADFSSGEEPTVQALNGLQFNGFATYPYRRNGQGDWVRADGTLIGKPRPHCTGKIEVPRDWDNLTEEEWQKRKAEREVGNYGNLPRHPPVPSVEPHVIDITGAAITLRAITT